MSELNGASTSERTERVLDLSDYAVERIPLKIGDYEGTIPSDLPLPLIIKLRKEWGALENLDELTEQEAVSIQDSLWLVAEEIFIHAEPPLGAPVRERLSLAGVMALLGFLARTLGEPASSMKSLQLPSSTRARSRSGNFSRARGSSLAPRG